MGRLKLYKKRCCSVHRIPPLRTIAQPEPQSFMFNAVSAVTMASKRLIYIDIFQA